MEDIPSNLHPSLPTSSPPRHSIRHDLVLSLPADIVPLAAPRARSVGVACGVARVLVSGLVCVGKSDVRVNELADGNFGRAKGLLRAGEGPVDWIMAGSRVVISPKSTLGLARDALVVRDR